jgi:hypothetical protein
VEIKTNKLYPVPDIIPLTQPSRLMLTESGARFFNQNDGQKAPPDEARNNSMSLSRDHTSLNKIKKEIVMAGKIKNMVNQIIDLRSKGSPAIAATTRTKLILKGINLDSYTETSDDDPNVINRLRQIATEFGVNIN